MPSHDDDDASHVGSSASASRSADRAVDLASASAEGRRLKTVQFLSALNKDGYVRDYRQVDNSRLEERCYFSCSLPGPSGHAASRGRPKEPDCLALCYIQLKDTMTELDRSAAEKPRTGMGAPNMTADLARAFGGTFPSPDEKGKAREDARYRWSALEGKYIYKARGRMAIAKHAEGETTPEAVREMERLQELNPPGKMVTRGERLGIVKRSPILAPPSYEVLYPMCTTISDRLHRFEKHLVRIYGPTYRALQKLPEMYAEGSQIKLAGQLYKQALSGDGLALGQRLLESSVSMLKKWKENVVNRSGSSSGSGGGSNSGADKGQGGGSSGVNSQNGVPGRGPPPGFGSPPVEPPPPAA